MLTSYTTRGQLSKLRNYRCYLTINWTAALFRFHQFFTDVLLLFQHQMQGLTLHFLDLPHRCPPNCDSSSVTSTLSWPSYFLKSTDQVFLRTFVNLCLSDTFSWFYWSRSFGEEHNKACGSSSVHGRRAFVSKSLIGVTLGAPSRLSIWLWLRSRSRGSWVRAPSWDLCWQLRAWSLP